MRKRIIVGLMVLSTGCLPAIGTGAFGCPSGAQQEGMLQSAWNAYGDLALNNMLQSVSASPSVWNQFALGLARLGANLWVTRQIDFAVPDDPFPGP